MVTIRRGFVVAAVLFLIAWIVYGLAFVFFPLSASVSVYRLFVNNGIYGPLVLFTLVVLVGTAVVKTRAVAVAVCAMLLAAGAYVGHFLTFNTYQEIDTLRLDNHIYHLLLNVPDFSDTSLYYYLYECDSLDALCREIGLVMYSDLVEQGIKQVESVSLVAGDSVMIEVNGKIVFPR